MRPTRGPNWETICHDPVRLPILQYAYVHSRQPCRTGRALPCVQRKDCCPRPTVKFPPDRSAATPWPISTRRDPLSTGPRYRAPNHKDKLSRWRERPGVLDWADGIAVARGGRFRAACGHPDCWDNELYSQRGRGHCPDYCGYFVSALFHAEYPMAVRFSRSYRAYPRLFLLSLCIV